MNELEQAVDTQFEAWLHQANRDLVNSTTQSLDLDALLVQVKQQAVADINTPRSKPHHVARELVRAAAGTVLGALALKSPHGPEPHQAKILPFPGPSGPTGSTGTEGRPEGIADSVDGAISGDARAMEHLLALIRPLVVRYCRARVGRQERSFVSADDVAQEVCIAVLTALPGYRDQGRPFLAFVYGIAAHKVADAHRAAARNRSELVAELPDEPDEEAGPELQAIRGELSDQIAELLKVLPPKQREILVLRVVVGLSAEETADLVGSTPGAVRVAQHRALNHLRAALPSSYLDERDGTST